MKVLCIALLLAACYAVTGSAQAQPVSVDVNGLRLSARVFLPATASGPVAVSNNDANSGYFFWLHSAKYGHFGRVTGIGDDAQWHPAATSSSVVEFLYLGSVFRNAGDAANAAADASTYPVAQYAAVHQGCPQGLPNGCARRRLAVSEPPASTRWYDSFTVGSCLIETMASLPRALGSVTGVKQHTLTTLATIDRAALDAAQKVCLPPAGTFTFELTRVVALDAQRHARSSFKVGQPFFLSLRWRVRHLNGHATASIVNLYQVPNSTGWKTIDVGRTRLVAVNGVNPFSKQVVLNSPARYRILVTVTIKSLSRQGSVSLTITR